MARKSRESSVNIDLSGVEVSRKVIPEGTYQVVVNEAKMGKSKEDKPKVAFEFEVSEGPNKGFKLFENCSLQPQALFKLKSLLMALGVDIPDGAFDLNLKDLIGLTCEVEVGHEVYEGKKRARILEFINPTESGEEDDDDEDDDGDEGSEDLEERLSEMDKEELKELALELEIPKKKVLAAKKVTALVELIMEEAEEESILAALDSDDSDDEDDEDDGDNDDTPDYSEMSLAELKAECKNRGLKVKKGMDEEDLIEMLEEDDEE